MTAAERRERLVDAALAVFSEHGVEGATMKQVAEAAGVSEALVYKHFDGKDALYQAALLRCTHKEGEGHENIHDLPPSLSSLVFGLHWLVEKVMRGDDDAGQRHETIRRLLLRSALSDGDFIRTFVANKTERVIDQLEQCVVAAERDGDLPRSPYAPRLRLWLAYHTAVGLAAMRVDGRDAADFGLPYDDMVPAVVRFGLRGLGLTDADIDKVYNPAALAFFLRRSPG